MKAHLKSEIKLGSFHQNIGTMFIANGKNFAKSNSFGARVKDHYRYWTWKQLTDDILAFSCYLKTEGLHPSDKVCLISSNSYHRLVCEMAIMASGMVAVPIFPGYPFELMGELIQFSDCKLLIIEGQEKIATLAHLGHKYLPKKIIEMHQVSVALKTHCNDSPEEMLKQWQTVSADQCCLIMYTSGTTTFPKGVMLTHRNIL